MKNFQTFKFIAENKSIAEEDSDDEVEYTQV